MNTWIPNRLIYLIKNNLYTFWAFYRLKEALMIKRINQFLSPVFRCNHQVLRMAMGVEISAHHGFVELLSHFAHFNKRIERVERQ